MKIRLGRIWNFKTNFDIILSGAPSQFPGRQCFAEKFNEN